jgi:hypothetical protein
MRLYLTFMPSGVPDQMLVERVELSVSGKLYPSDWQSRRVEQGFRRFVFFDVPDAIIGEHETQVVAWAIGKSWGTPRQAVVYPTPLTPDMAGSPTHQ